MNPANATECLAALREVMVPLEVIHERIEQAHAEEEGLARKLTGLHGQQRENEDAASSPTRLRLCQHATSLEDAAIERKEALAAAIKEAAVHAAKMLAPAVAAKLTALAESMLPFSENLQRATETAKTTDAFRAAQQMIDRLHDHNQIYHRGIPMNRLLKQARLVEAILMEASRQKPDFSQFLAPAPAAAH